MQDEDPEETYHSLYMKRLMEEAGITCKIITGLSGLHWDDAGFVIDSDGEQINWVWKTWAWETALDQLRIELSDNATAMPDERLDDKLRRPPRLSDVLLREEVMVFEPLWTLIPSNKAILPVLWMLYPNHPYLLNTQFELTDDLKSEGYVSKPIVGRCGENISIFDTSRDVVVATEGQFEHHDEIYQQLFRLPKIEGRSVQIGTFTAGGTLGGGCVRADVSPIIRSDSNLLALRILNDAAFLAWEQKDAPNQ
jgi:glutathionylspermidine amidase/synthetase